MTTSYKRTPIEARKLWVDALRSGTYEQTRGVLRRVQYQDEGRVAGWCCLGVACDVYEHHERPLEKCENSTGNIKYQSCLNSVPGEVREWLGLSTVGGTYEESSLWELNDCARRSFSEIADIIESAPTGLFVEDTR